LNLRIRQVSLAARTIRLDPGTTKNENGREVSMAERIDVLAKQATAGKLKDDFLLTRDDGKRVRCFRTSPGSTERSAATATGGRS